MVDLGKQLKFPAQITVTSLRPDIIILSAASKQLALIELTVPWEDLKEEAFERTHAKYQGLLEEHRKQGWRAHCHPVGFRGFVSHSFYRV